MILEPTLLWTIGIVLVAILALAWPFMRRELVPSGEELALLQAPRKATPSAAPTEMPATPAQLQAVIIAAVATVIEEEFRLLDIEEDGAEVNIGTQWTAWSTEGRRQIFASHRLR